MRTKNSIQNTLMNKKQITNNTDKYTHSGVYKLSCPDCNKAYVGQTGRSFLTRFKTSNQSSNYAKHFTEHTHTFSAPSKTSCRYYNARTKEHTSIP